MTEPIRNPGVRPRSAHEGDREPTFHETLYDWMSAAPWLLLSAAGHLLVFFVLAAVPWDELEPPEPPSLHADLVSRLLDPPPPPPDVPDLVEPTNDVEEPQLRDSTLDESPDVPDAAPTAGDPDFLADDPFDEPSFRSFAGLDGPPAGARGRHGPGDGGDRIGGRKIETVLRDALNWLERHQSPDGSWDCDGFGARCGELGPNVCDGAGAAEHDVGVTGLALLAFLGMGSTTRSGPYREVVQSGISWLKSRQDPDSGLIGDRTSREFLYDHAIATLALCENYYDSRSPTQGRAAQRAVDFIGAARDPYGVWRYDAPSIGEGDTSVTGWMLFALASARDAGLEVDTAAFDGVLAFLQDVTDPRSGRAGYLTAGGSSSRLPGVNDDYPVEKGEAMTAVALLCRVFLGQDPAKEPVMLEHAELLLRTLPRWEPVDDRGGRGCDMYYWYYGTYAMYQMGAYDARYWHKWESELDDAVIEPQRRDGDERGSWDPVGPWGSAGGRVYSTALQTLTLEVHYRYARILGTR